MVKNPDEYFFDRADKHIDLSNAQLGDATAGKVSASMMYAAARFNVWLSASELGSKAELKKEKQRTIKYFMTQYRKMLEDNMEDYIENFDSYVKAPSDDRR